MNIFFDLDGTLIDSRERLYQLFQKLVPQSKLSFDKYWSYKRNKIGHSEILVTHFNYSDNGIAEFQNKWMQEIELSEWLVLDKPFEGVTPFLNQLKQECNLFVVTARQFESQAIKQIDQLGWSNIFSDILVTNQKFEKYDLLTRLADNIERSDWFVGDTGKDIQTGKRLGINTAAVLSGFLNAEKLSEYKPDIIVENVLMVPFKPV